MSTPRLIPLQVLFGHPDRVNPHLSPDGKSVIYAAPVDGVLNLAAAPVDGSSPPQILTEARGRGIYSFVPCWNGRHLVYSQDNGDEITRLYRLDLNTGETVLLTPEQNVRAGILAHSPAAPDTLLVTMNLEHPALHDVYSIDLGTDAPTPVKIETNPGVAGGTPFASWLVGPDLTVCGGLAFGPGGDAIVCWRAAPGQEYRPLVSVPMDDVDTYFRSWVDADGTLWMITFAGGNTRRLVCVDTATGALTVVAEGSHDICSVWPDPDTLRPLSAAFDGDRLYHKALEEDVTADLDALAGIAPDEDFLPVGTSADGARWLVRTTAPHSGERYHLYDRTDQQTHLLFPANSALTSYDLARSEPFGYPARDQRSISGYLTFPPGRERQNLPTVLYVHGGPWERDRYRYDRTVQALANRGYLVVQVNYRGSAGLGKDHLNAGNKQWGRAMQDDLLDAVKYVIARGWADPARVAIFGGSYGGYAAMAGVTFTPTVFAAAISLCGPVHLRTLVTSLPPDWGPMLSYFHHRVGHPETDAELLEEVSPLTFADRIAAPVLIGQGANDSRVTAAEVEQIIAAMEKHGIPHQYTLYEGEGHGLVRESNQLDFAARALNFLAEHLGGLPAAVD